MRKKEVVIGAQYMAKVSGRVVPVQIEKANPYGGWFATNTITGRSVRIRSAAKLRSRYVPSG